MIVDFFLSFVASILEPITSALPQASMPSAFGSLSGNIGAMIYKVDYYIPVQGPLHTLALALYVGWIPILSFAIGLFIYRRVRG